MSSLGMSGVFSGIDTDTLVSRIMAINTRPVALMQVRQGTWEEKISAVDSIESRLTQLKGLAGQLRDSDTLVSVIASSSDSTVMTASASGGRSRENTVSKSTNLPLGIEWCIPTAWRLKTPR